MNTRRVHFKNSILVFLISIVISAALFLPKAAYAGEVPEESGEPGPVAAVGTEEFLTLPEAVSYASSGDTIVILDYITLDETLVIDKDLAFDMGSCDITNAEDFATGTGAPLIRIASGGSLTVDNGMAGQIITTGDCAVLAEGHLTLEEGIICANHRSVYMKAGSLVDINGGTVFSEANTAIELAGTGAELNVTAGTVLGKPSIVFSTGSSAEINIEGGMISSSGSGNGAIYLNKDGATLTVTGGYLEGGGSAVKSQYQNHVYIEGGTLDGSSWSLNLVKGYDDCYVSGGTFYGPVRAPSNVREFITGGKFDSDLTEDFLADGYTQLENGLVVDTRAGINDAIIQGADGSLMYYTQLSSAFDAASEGDTVVLLQDCSLDTTVSIDTYINLELNGKTVTGTASQAFSLTGGADLWIRDSSDDETGKIKAVSVAKVSGGASLTLEGGTLEGMSENEGAVNVYGSTDGTETSSVTLLGGTVRSGNGTAVTVGGGGALLMGSGRILSEDEDHPAVMVSSYEGTAEVILNGGEIESAGGAAVCALGSGASVSVNGGSITSAGSFGIASDGGALSVSGGTVTGATGIYSSGSLDVPEYSDAVITGNGSAGSYPDAASTGEALMLEKTGNAESGTGIAAGTFISVNASPVGSYAEAGYTAAAAFISGGYFSAQVPAAFLAEGYICEEAGDDAPAAYIVKEPDPVAETGGVIYPSLQEAFDAAENGGTVTLAADTLKGTGAVLENKTVTLDLNGFKYRSLDPYAVSLEGSGALTVTDGGEEGIIQGGEESILVNGRTAALIVSSGSVKGGRYAVKISDMSSVTINGGTLEGRDAGIYARDLTGTAASFSVTGGTIKASGNDDLIYTDDGAGADIEGAAMHINAGTVNITGGTLEGTDFGIYSSGSGIINAGGGSISAGTGVRCRSGAAVNVTDGDITGKTYGIHVSGGTLSISGGAVRTAEEYIFDDADVTAAVYTENGTVLTVSDDALIEGSMDDAKADPVSGSGCFGIFAGGDITMTGGVVSGSTAVKTDHDIDISSGIVAGVKTGIAVVSGTADVSGDADISGACGILASGQEDGRTQVNISGGSVTGTDCGIMTSGNAGMAVTGGRVKSSGGIGIFYSGDGELALGCTGNKKAAVSGTTAVFVSGGTVRIGEKAELLSSGEKREYAYTEGAPCDTGDALSVENSGKELSVSVTGGRFISANGEAIASYAAGENEPLKGFVSGGVFSNAIDKCLVDEDLRAEGCGIIKNLDTQDPGTYVIGTVTLDAADITEPGDQPYAGGDPVCPEITVTLNGEELTAGTDYSIEFSDNTTPGTAAYIITGITLPGTKDGTFDIVPRDDIEAFVTRLYNICLDRRPDAGGLNGWVQKLRSKEQTGATVARNFIFSREFKNKNYCNECFVKYLYRAFMNREYDEEGLSYWVERLEIGRKRQQIFNGFTQSAEFKNICESYGIERGSKVPIPAVENAMQEAVCPICGAEPPVKYTISYILNGGRQNSANRTWYTVESADFTPAAPTKTGYTFAGWYSDSGFKTRVTVIKNGSSGNRTLYAKWTANTYTIRFNSNGGTSGTMADLKCTYGTAKTLTANAFKRTGYTFNGWNTKKDGTGTAYKNRATVKNLVTKNGGSITLYAQWKK